MTVARRILRRLSATAKITVAALVVMLLLVLLALYGLTATHSGSRWLLQQLINSTEQISVARIEGTLLSELTLRQFRYQQHDGFSLTIAAGSLRWNPADLLRRHLHIQFLQLEGIEIHGQPATSEKEKSDSTIPEIPLRISLDRIAVTRLNWQQGESKTVVDELTASAHLENNRLNVSDLNLKMPELEASAGATVQLSSDWPLTADLNWLYRVDETGMKGRLDLSGTMHQFDLVSHISAPFQSSQTGHVRLTGAQPEFFLTGDWRKLHWPFQGAAEVSSRQGKFQVQGTPDSYQASLTADVIAKDQPPFSADFAGTGNREGMKIERLQLKPATGQVTLKGDVSWAYALAFDLGLAAERLNPADYGSDIPALLNLKAHGKGTVKGDQYAVDLDIASLYGTLYDQPVNANGKVSLNDRQLDIDKLRIKAGRNRLTATGTLNEKKADILAEIDAPDLHSAWPELAGKLTGRLSVKGSAQKPVIKSTFRGSNLRFEDKQIARLSLKADYEQQSARLSFLDFFAADVQLGNEKINRLTLQGRGTPEQHKLSMSLESTLANVDVSGDGAWDGRQWLADIRQFDIEHPQLRNWRLAEPARLTIRPEQKTYHIDLPTSCLQQNAARLCFSALGVPAQQLDGQLSIAALPLATARPWLPDTLALSGDINARGQFSSAQGELSAGLDADLLDARLTYTDDQNVSKTLPFTASTLRMQYRQDRLDARVNLGLGRDDHINAVLTAGATDPAGTRKLAGNVQARINSMQVVGSLIPDIDRLEGRLHADLAIGGTSEQPLITGSAGLQNGRFDLPKLGDSFRNIAVNVRNDVANPDRLDILAVLESGKGRLTGRGWMDLDTTRNFPLTLNLTGKQFQISRIPEAEVVVSPDLTVKKYDNLTNVAGLIKIDSARLKIKSVPESAVAVSEDQVIVSPDQTQQKTPPPPNLQTRITIDFGDKTHFEGFGLKTDLTGQLNYVTRQDKQRLMGRAEMKNASYRSYGQDLSLRKGEFVFNGPTDNPWLNIEAFRKANNDDVTAVLSVTGPLKSPQTRVYTEPPLPESEALSYLVTGKSTQNLGKGEGTSVAQAAFNYGAGQLSWLSDKLGIDEFEFEQGETIKDSAVKLGEYLNPDLYVGVKMGMFTNQYAAEFKYRLSDHFTISSRAGDTQRIDLKYHFEMN